MAAWHTRIEQRWYAPDLAPPLMLRALARLYAGALALRRTLYRHGLLRRVRLGVPVIVVGNITVGGTGKTPLVIALVEALRARGYRPGVISRGYGGSATMPLLVQADSDPAVVGDEPCLIRQRSGVPLAIGRDRIAAAELLLAAHALDVLIADDGLQHDRLRRDVELCVIDGARRFGNRQLLPAGPLREPLSRLDRVDFRVCNGAVPQPGEVLMTLRGDCAVAVADASMVRPLADFAGAPVHALAGIGNPTRFFTALRGFGLDPTEHPFPDHHAYQTADLAFASSQPLLMTEKDAVKCRAFAGTNHWYVPVHAELPQPFFDAVAAKLPSAQPRQQAH